MATAKPPEEAQKRGSASDDIYRPGDDDPDFMKEGEMDLGKWHDFESQYSIAMETAVVVEREAWGNQIEFLMSCIASAVGLGNIWRFPFICGQNGGGAFLIPYICVLFLIGRPMYMMELGLGQFVSGGPVKIWEMAPAFRGVGYVATLASICLGSFYVVIMGWSLCFVGYSCFFDFPWKSGHTFTPIGMKELTMPARKPGQTDDQDTGHPGFFFGIAHLGEPLVGDRWLESGEKVPNNQFFRGEGLDGFPVGAPAIGLVVGWLLIWANLVVGVSGSGKVAYFTALFPYVVLLILLIGGATLDGAAKGLEIFFFPEFDRLTPASWFVAVGQCFFSLGITFGGTIMFASFNHFNHKLNRDIIIISIMDTFTSLLAGSCFFMLLGALQVSNKGDPEYLVENSMKKEGAGMAFTVFPQVLPQFAPYPGPNVISFLFFFMLCVLALGSANGIIGTVVTVICDEMPKFNRRIVVTVVCVSSCLVGLVYTCPTGNNVIDIVDKYGTEQVAYMVAIFETVGIIYVYGLKNLCNDFEYMLGYKVNLYWIISWGILPVLLICIFIIYMGNPSSHNQKNHPLIAVLFGWALTVLLWLVLPFTMGLVIFTRKSRKLKKRVKASFLPTRKWGPKDPATREAWRRWKRTKPTEFTFTRGFLDMCGCSKDELPPGTQPYAIGPVDSEYQTAPVSQTGQSEMDIGAGGPSIQSTAPAPAEAPKPAQNVT